MYVYCAVAVEWLLLTIKLNRQWYVECYWFLLTDGCDVCISACLFVTSCINVAGNAVACVHPFVCFHSIFGTD